MSGNGHRLSGYTDEASSNAPVSQDRGEDELHGIAGKGERQTLGRVNHGSVHTNHLAVRRDERPSRATRIERSIGLHDVLQQPPRPGPQRATDRADHTARHRVLKPERVANRDHEPPGSECARIAKPCPGKRRAARRVDPQHCQVALGIVADQVCAARSPVEKRHLDAPDPPDDMTVGHHEAIGREQEAGAPAATPVELDDGGGRDIHGLNDRA